MASPKNAKEKSQEKDHQDQPLSTFVRLDTPEALPSTPMYRLLYLAAGQGEMTVADGSLGLSPKAICLLAPAHPVSFAWEEKSELLLITFSPLSLTEEGISGLTALCKRLFFVQTPPKAAEECLKKVEGALALPKTEQKLLIKLALTELLLHLQMYAAVAEEAGEHQPLSVRLKQHLDQNLTSPQPLDDLAKRFFVSKYYLCRCFKADFGVSVHHYLSSKRVELACRLIARGETASAAAYHVGFGDYSSFYRAYKKYKGQAPSTEPKYKSTERGNT